MHRPTLGVVSLVLIIGGAILMVQPISGDSYLGAIALRSGLVLGSVWLALPNIRKAPRWLLYGAGVLAAVLIARPRLFLYALPVAALTAFHGATSPSSRRKGD